MLNDSHFFLWESACFGVYMMLWKLYIYIYIYWVGEIWLGHQVFDVFKLM
jgi:hypothetical protein